MYTVIKLLLEIIGIDPTMHLDNDFEPFTACKIKGKCDAMQYIISEYKFIFTGTKIFFHSSGHENMHKQNLSFTENMICHLHQTALNMAYIMV